jgi:endonuclease-3
MIPFIICNWFLLFIHIKNSYFQMNKLDIKNTLFLIIGENYMKMTVKEVLDILSFEYPNPKSELNYDDLFSLLIAVILSAQATDISINKVTPHLFEAYPDLYSLAKADINAVMKTLNSISLYRNKSRFIIETSKKIINEFGGKIPQTREKLMSLPGVGRKTANVVLAEGFRIPTIAVDTHIIRVAKRLNWVGENDSVLDIEKKLMSIIPKERWIIVHHQLLLFGRYQSKARDTRYIYEVLYSLKEKQNNIS